MLGNQRTLVFIDGPCAEFDTGTVGRFSSARGSLDCAAVGVGVKIAVFGKKRKDANIAVYVWTPVTERTTETEKALVVKPFRINGWKKPPKHLLKRRTGLMMSWQRRDIVRIRVIAEYAGLLGRAREFEIRRLIS